MHLIHVRIKIRSGHTLPAAIRVRRNHTRMQAHLRLVTRARTLTHAYTNSDDDSDDDPPDDDSDSDNDSDDDSDDDSEAVTRMMTRTMTRMTTRMITRMPLSPRIPMCPPTPRTGTGTPRAAEWVRAGGRLRVCRLEARGLAPAKAGPGPGSGRVLALAGRCPGQAS